MTTPEALKALYVALGGDADDVATANTSVDVLNAIAVKFEGDGDATLNPDAIMNVVAVLDNMIPDPTLIDKNITANGTYNASSDEADGYKKVVVNVAPVSENNCKLIHPSGSNAFNPGTFIKEVESFSVPDGFLQIGTAVSGSFSEFGRLKEVEIPSSIQVITEGVFNVSTLEKITIHKAEGSITGAPWGAPASCQIIWAG